MVDRLITFALIAVGAVQVFPIILAFSPSSSMRLYGIALPDDTTALLMRHRAVLLALVGVLLFAAAALPALRPAALAIALASKGSFILLALLTRAPTAEAVRVARVDGVTFTVLIGVAIALWMRRSST